MMTPRYGSGRVARAGVGDARPLNSGRLRVAVLLSTRFFEDFYGREVGITGADYLESYRNDWSWDWCALLHEQGIDARIYVASLDESGATRTADGFGVRFLSVGRSYWPWVRFPVLERSPLGRFVGQAANAAAFLRPLQAALADDRIDVLCVQEYWTARFDVLARALSVPIVAVDQGLPDRHEVKLLKRGSFARASRVIVQTAAEAVKVATRGGSAVQIPNAVDAELFSPAPARVSAVPPSVLCTGRLHDAQKRTSDLIKALVLLPPDWSLDVVGTGPDQQALQSLARQAGVVERVRFHGFVGSKQRLRDLYRTCGVFALPSAYEGLPMGLLEAMACGAAVVGSDIAAIASVVDPRVNGLLTPVGRPDRLAAALLEAFTRRDELGAGARAVVESRFSRAAVGPTLASCFREAAHGGPGS